MGRRSLHVGLLVAVVVAVLDQATKSLAVALLELGEFVPLLGEHVGWELVLNPGGAFGLPAPSWVFLVVTAVVLGLVLRVLPHTRSLTAAIAYGLLLAGALGNVIDRLVRPGGDGLGQGWVVDFVAWGAFPRFNVADSAITVGFVLLLAALLIEERRGDEAPGGSASDGSASDGSGSGIRSSGAAGSEGDASDGGGAGPTTP